tara:strand:- start:629 stop:2542 length:1914 start_codon:yes stop_codon:yes gene_type:complete
MATVKSRGVNYDKFEDSGLLTPYLSESQNRAADAEGFRDFLGKYVTPDQIGGALYSIPVAGTGALSKGLGYLSDIFNYPGLGSSLSQAGDEYFDSAGGFLKEGLLGIGTKDPEVKKSTFTPPKSKSLLQLKKEREQNFKDISAMPETSSVFDEDVDMGTYTPMAVAKQQSEQQAKEDERTNLDAFPKLSENQAKIAENEMTILNAMGEAGDDEGDYGTGVINDGDAREGESVAERTTRQLQEEALIDAAKSKGEEVTPATREELLAKYKKEFYEATGLDPSGKADKSSALMAMGLALMQNKAGKGFNVGRMLSAVGEAGEKALPKLEAAKKAAKAEALASGQYALGRIQAGESAAAAIKASSLKHLRAIDLQNQKAKIDFKIRQAEKGVDLGSGYGVELNVGAKPIKYRMSYNKTTGQDKILNPFGLAGQIKNRYEDANKGFQSAKELKVLLQGLKASSNTGGTAGQQVKEKLQRYAKSLGWNEDTLFQDAYEYRVGQIVKTEGVTEAEAKKDPRALRLKGISFTSSTEILQDALLARFKRFMTQETGNGISTFDIKTAAALTGKIEMFGDIDKSIGFINELEELFNSSLNSMDTVLGQLTQEDYYTNMGEYDRTQTLINSLYAPKNKKNKTFNVSD